MQSNPPVICPKCAYRRKENEVVPDYECPSCGIVYAKYIQWEQAQETSNAPSQRDAVPFHIVLYKIVFCLSIAIIALPAFPVQSIAGLGKLLGSDMELFENYIFRVVLLTIIFGFFVFKSGLHHKIPVVKWPSLMLVASTLCALYIGQGKGAIWASMDFYMFKDAAIEIWHLLSIGYIFKLLAEQETGEPV